MKDNKTTGAENVRWDLSFMYSGVDDSRLDEDVLKFAELAKEFQVQHKGKLSENLGQAVHDYSEILMLGNKLNLYLYLRYSTNVSDASIKAKLADVERVLSQAQGEYMTFFMIELVALENSVLEKLYSNDPIVSKHRPWIEHSRIFKPHILSEPVESALTKRSPFGSSAWSQFFDEFEADLEFEFKNEKKTLTEMLHIVTDSKDAEDRFEGMTAVNSGLKGHFAKYSAQTLYMTTGSEGVEVKERKYKNPMDSRNKSNRTPDLVVEALHKSVLDVAGPLAKRYYRLKAEHLGLKTLSWSDRNAPMPFTDTTIVPFNEAEKIVIAAYESFSPTLARLVRESISSKRIDAPAVKGKQNGAYNYSLVLPNKIPVSFTFLNYLGSNRDIMTFAHELGHGVHGLLAGEEQGPLMSHAPIAYCETASVFGEMITFNFLKDRLSKSNDKKSLLAMTMSKIDDVINTVVRQIGFSNFERRVHGMDKNYKKWSEPKKLSVDELSIIWLETLKELYGEEGEIFTYENTEYLWSYINHFHHFGGPFYVYGYAFGQLLTNSIYAKQSELGKEFEPLYLSMLKSGSTLDVVELLKPFDLDPTNEKFWTEGINKGLGVLVEEAERLSHEIGFLN